MNLPTSEHYFTQIGFSEEFKRDVYQIVNRETEVVEYETSAMGYLIQGIEGLENMYNGPSKATRNPLEQVILPEA